MKKSDLFQHIADLYREVEELKERVAALEGVQVTSDPPPSGGGPGEEGDGGGNP